jgi:two-component system chemotaxis response regulator CheY
MRILLIDDSNTTRRIQKNQLNQIGIDSIFEAPDGKKGLEMLKENMPIDLVLLDQNMPVMDGLSCLKTIRTNQTYKNVRVIMCTSEKSKESIIEAIKAGANDYITKPFLPEDLKKKILVSTEAV